MSATSSNNTDCLITTIDPRDLLTLQAFDQAKSSVLVLGSALKLKISKDVNGALSTVIYKNYILHRPFGNLDIVSVPIHVQTEEVEFVSKVTNLTAADLVTHSSGDVVMVGNIPIELIHTPGHTPGSQCFMLDGALVSGDTLFLEGCGRTDLPGGDPLALYESLTQKLAKVPDDSILFPGHLYSAAPCASMGETRHANFVFRPKTPEQWLAMFSG